MGEINNLIVVKIKEIIPSNINIVNVLMETLSLGREAIYRRLKNIVPFTFNEIAILSSKFNFSLDEIVNQGEKRTFSINMPHDVIHNPQEMFKKLLVAFVDLRTKISYAKKSELSFASNLMLLPLVLNSGILTKFFYYKWSQMYTDRLIPLTFSETVVPADIIDLRNKLNDLHNQMTNTHSTYILDKNIYLNAIEEVRYYYKRNLISTSELELIKKEFLNYINDTENMVMKGKTSKGAEYLFFLSAISVDSNCMYIRSDNNEDAYFNLYSILPVQVNHIELCRMQKSWLRSLKKYSVLISQSNDMLRVKFFERQREYLENIQNDSYYSLIEI